jgi:hypothetical protein
MKCDESMAGGVGWWDDGQLVRSVFCVCLCFVCFGRVPCWNGWQHGLICVYSDSTQWMRC